MSHAPYKTTVVATELKQRRPRSRSIEVARPVIPDVFIVLDLETTGLSPFDDEIIEFGALRVSRATAEAICFRSLVKPEGRIPPVIAELTGITQQMVDAEGVALGEALTDFLEFIGDLPLVTYNAKFDIAFLREAASKHGHTIANSYTCALELARCAWPGLPSYKLVDISKSTYSEIEIASSPELDAHRALGDCKRTVKVFLNAATSLAWDIPWMSLSANPGDEEPRQRLSEGKHRGTTPMYEHSVSMHGDVGGPLVGEVVVFTGSLSIPRGQASALAAAAGCEVRVGVTHRTTVVVVGTQDMSLLAGKERSCKQLEAAAIIREGQAIRILSETEFIRLIVETRVGVIH